MVTKSPDAAANLLALRQRITDLVARNAVAMVQCAIDGVLEDGQYQAIKYLFELVGIYPSTASGNQEPDDTLSRLLLQHLGVPLQGNEVPTGGTGSIHPVE